jgi:hypothetical protein
MPKYVIERHIPDAGKLTADDLRGIATRSNAVLAQMGPQIQWIQSFVTDNAITCVYLADNEELLREHASRGKFPITRVEEVRAVIDPTTANGPVAARS